MRKACLILALGLITIAACNKPADNSNVKLPVGYHVDGVSDVMVERDSTAELNLFVDLATGVQEQVTVTVSGLPANVTAKVTPETGTPDYTTTITFRATEKAVVGKYAIEVTATSASGSKSYKMNLNVVNISECVSRLIGDFDAWDLCDTSVGTPYIISVVPDMNKTNRIVMQGFSGSVGWNVYANINCNAKSLTMPKQTIMGTGEISGTGSYVGYDSITFNYTVLTPFDTTMCTTGLKVRP